MHAVPACPEPFWVLAQREKMSKGRWLFENLEPENEGKDAGGNGGCDADHLHCSSLKLSPCSAFSKHSLKLFTGSLACYGRNDAFYIRCRGFNDTYG